MACKFSLKWRFLDVGVYFIAIEIEIGIEFCTIAGYCALSHAIRSTTELTQLYGHAAHFRADQEIIDIFFLFPGVFSFDTDFDSDSDFDDAFSALISDKAIIHTTGLPVAYSFELDFLRPL